MQAKDFLLSECKNLSSVLQQTLRYEYGLEGSREFYEECEARLAHIKQELTQIAPGDFDRLSDSSIELENLSSLICRIERSSLGEYSWPFVEEFKRIAKAVCTEPSSLKAGTPPKVHVLSEGGLSAYSIYTEPNRSISQKRILTIIFPRTLKHFVLLHPILGHEIGHAIYSYAQYQHELNKIFLSNLVLPSSNFKDEAATVNWLYSTSAPKGVQLYLTQLNASLGVDAKNFFYSFAYYDAWIEEFLCDFIGLLMFGPSFLAAHCNLLYSIDPSGVSVSDYHPLTGCRVNMLLTAAEIMGYDTLVFDSALQPAVNAFWTDLKAKRQTDKWFDLFTEQQIRATLTGLKEFLAKHENALYPIPTVTQIQPLLKQIIELTPPVGYEFSEQNGPNCIDVDFRHTLYAGWIASSDTTASIPFDTVNRLCEHGIMQQGAIKLKNTEKVAS